MKQGISIAFFYIVLQYGLIMFIFPQSIIQSQTSGHWLTIVLGWLLQGGLLRLLIGGFHTGNEDLLASFVQAGKVFRILLVWPLIAGNLLAISVIIRGHSQVLSMLFLPNTPLWVLLALFLVTAVGVSYVRRDTLLRLAMLLGLFGIPLLLLTLAEALKNVTFLSLFPIQPTFSFLDEPGILSLMFVFSHIIGLIGFMGSLSLDKKRWLWGAWGCSSSPSRC